MKVSLLAPLLLLLLPASAAAQIESVAVQRIQFDRQIAPGTLVPDNIDQEFPFGMDTAVHLTPGSSPLSPLPRVSGPIALTEPGFNGGVLGHNPSWDWHNLGAAGTGWGTDTAAEMDALFGSGIYTVDVSGISHTLDLQASARPATSPVLTPNHTGPGGGWHDGIYYFTASADHTVSVSPYAGFGTNVEDALDYRIKGCGFEREELFLASQGGSNAMLIDIPATTLTPGVDYLLEANFTGLSDLDNSPGYLTYAGYTRTTRMIFRVIEEGTAFGDVYCEGGGGTLIASGSSTVGSATPLRLTATGLPTTGFGIFIASRDQGFVANPGGSDGTLCLGGTIGRILDNGSAFGVDPCGTFEVLLDPLVVPQNAGVVPILPGETWNFQAWYRSTPIPRFTDAISVTFD